MSPRISSHPQPRPNRRFRRLLPAAAASAALLAAGPVPGMARASSQPHRPPPVRAAAKPDRAATAPVATSPGTPKRAQVEGT
jgi:hypothetical protein